MMKRHFLWLIPLIMLSHDSWAQTAVIQEVGIQGFYSGGTTPTRVRVQLANPGPQPITLNLSLSVAEKDARFGRVDRFDSSVTLQAADVRSIDLPIPVFAGRPLLTFEATTPEGRTVARQSRALERPQANALVVLLCAEDKTCNEILGTIGASGNDEQKARKTKSYTFLVVKDLPEEWWIYGPAHSVILARPASGLSARQREALEGFCRLRGQLAVVDNLLGPGFLDEYRAAPAGIRNNVGSGALFRFRDAADLANFLDRSVGDLQDGDEAKNFREHTRFNAFRIASGALQLATIFEFPTLRWLIIWLVLYIVMVGAVNFFVLTRIDRRELAWITVPAMALLFAVTLYFTSAAKRPDSIGVDEIATYYMDDQSPRAAAYYDLRLSSPHRQDLSLSVPGDAIWNGSDRMLGSVATFSIFDRNTANLADGWSIRLLPERKFEIPMLQWSYQDLSLSGMKVLPGTIRNLPGGQLENQTGLSFKQAVYLADGDVYDLGAIAAGATFTPRKGTGEDAENVRKAWREHLQHSGLRFDLNSRAEVKQYLANYAGGSYPVLVGLAEAPVLGASIPGQTYTHRQYVIAVVGMRGAP